MNKKVLTLCAGFLLAGGMLSSVSAVKLSEAANTGKYYKIVRAAYNTGDLSSDTWTEDDGITYYMTSNGYISGLSPELTDLWQVTKDENNRYTLTSLSGEKMFVKNDKDVYVVNEVTVGSEKFEQLKFSAGSQYVGLATKAGENNFWKFEIRKKGTSATGQAFEAQETELSLPESFGNVLQNGHTYRLAYGKEILPDIYQAVANGTGTWSLKNNKTGNLVTIDGAETFKVVYGANNSAYLEIPSGGKYVDVEDGTLTLTDDLTKATIFAFCETGVTDFVEANILNFYEKDGFSVTIKYQDKNGQYTQTDIEGNEFTGHLTTINENFQAATTERQFYLKNAAGKYIVATPSVEGSYQSAYKFTTVTEEELKRDLSDNTVGRKYFGLFSAQVLEAEMDKDPKNLSQIAYLSVDVNGMAWTVGNLEVDGKATLKAASTNYWDALGLKPILISLGADNLVDAKDLLKKDKFFTVTKITKDGSLIAGTKENASNKVVNAWVESVGNVLESQWALTEGNGNYIFTNREQQTAAFSIPSGQLYKTNDADTYRYGADTYVIKPVEKHAATDGYDRLSDTKNTKFYLGYASDVFDNTAWFTENHEGTDNHAIGLDTNQENALVFTATEHSKARQATEQADFSWNYAPTDSIYVISTLGYYDGGTYKTTKDTLKVVSYSFVNQYGEPLVYGKKNYVSSTDKSETAPAAQKFALRQEGEKLNLRLVDLTAQTFTGLTDEGIKTVDASKLYNTFASADNKKVYAGDEDKGILNNVDLLYRSENDLFVVEETEKPMYRKIVNNLDTISIFRQENDKQMLFEDGKFLGLKNAAQFDFAPAMLADTAYVRYNTYRPQYLLAVDPVMHGETTWCPVHGYGATCQHAQTIKGYVEGRYLVNLVDTAIAWDKDNKHKDGNPYINSEKYYRLGFVQATHRNDSLIIANDNNRIFLGNNDYNLAKFAFRYVDQNAGSFVIETANYNRLPNATKAEINGVGYIKWMNGVVVVVDKMEDADVFNMNENEEGNPTANENIAAGNVVVAGVDGAVVVKGAEGKNVIVSTILGKVVANEVVSSDNATIAAPAGVVVVSVDGESFKVVVK